MAEKVLTLYFEDSSIKLLVAKGRKVESWAMVPLEPGLVAGGTIVDETKTADKVKELLASVKTRLFAGKGKVIVGLSGRDSASCRRNSSISVWSCPTVFVSLVMAAHPG